MQQPRMYTRQGAVVPLAYNIPAHKPLRVWRQKVVTQHSTGSPRRVQVGRRPQVGPGQLRTRGKPLEVPEGRRMIALRNRA